VHNLDSSLAVLGEMKMLALKAKEYLLGGALDDFGLLLNEGWRLKKGLASRITNSSIDEIYAAALKAGALGGKIAGAGGGGFLLLYCPPARQNDVRTALRDLPELTFNLERFGTKVIFNCAR
jgi:D-glycero-alpha-D-manno-heptose-7-phosphate kinase